MREHGFDNNGGTLMLSSAQMQEYMKAADFILARAIAPPQRPQTMSKTLTLHEANRRAIELTQKNLANRLANFDNLTPQEHANTRKVKAVAYALKNDGKPVRLKFTAEKPFAGLLP
ncbi:MAG: DUF1587 domain-containing protein [Planctomycetaceae bacterium]|nr:DUF1587 domain-containing protein [Planctomycetaceae bacterium]